MTSIDNVIQRVRAQRDALDDALRELTTRNCVGTSACGRVRAEVNSCGQLVDLALEESVTQLPGRQVSALIIEAANNAAAGASEARRAQFEALTRALSPPGD
ncbi:YbaB/EbfC family nucleoid-associated protein [Hoyosella rhizosphaerae]|uniref:YbaB/EbfC family DNA-binding protein n=1 Tax=Hoyosella rhizosphaerae TaxID=1755582 RepID=A0A916XDL6_9ACTN|nr:YbaB/EbfC family nucleoid-associated protein [Hoyosella rhizosphaerae]MBN4926064.1 YbaB/EbfC family nucleoid-associated protein [Hoyosella rhizosphaerae]GGC65837.1 hypothetical protein GCM10011410_17980 [Hoyosella rhizosphaerae]